jgi:hypothetical protein
LANIFKSRVRYASGLRGSRVTRVAHMRDSEMRVTLVKIGKSTDYKK